jgi:hypothetical protein
MSIYPIIIIPKDTILYSGGRWPIGDSCPDQFSYMGVGSRISRGKTIYLSNDETSAEGYATENDLGWVKKYVTNKEIPLLDITKREEQIEPYEMADKICNRTDITGYYLNWGRNIFEIATCEAREILTYLGTKQRISGKNFSEWKCLPKLGGKYKTKKYKTKKYKTKKYKTNKYKTKKHK